MREDVAAFHGSIDAARHTWKPPVAMSPDHRVPLFLDERELDPAMQYMLIHNGLVVWSRVSAAGRSGAAQSRLGWCGRGDDATRKVRALVGRCVERTSAKGATVMLEIDRADRDVNAVVDQLLVGWGDAWRASFRDWL